MWVRTCPECGYEQSAKPPNPDKELTDAYRNAECRRCKSPGLDYGREVHPVESDDSE